MAPNPPVQRAVQRAVNQPNINQPNANQPVVDYWDEVDNLHQDIINPVNAIINGDNYIIIPVQLFEDMHRFNINRRQAAILQAIQRQAAQPNIGN